MLLGGACGDVLQMRRALYGIPDVPSSAGRAESTAPPFDPFGATALVSAAPASRFRQRLSAYVGGLIQRAPQPSLPTTMHNAIVQAQQSCQNYVCTVAYDNLSFSLNVSVDAINIKILLMQMEEVIEMIVSIDDELFNYSLFDWFIDHSLGAKLLTLGSRFIETYLVRVTRENPTRYIADLLWHLYEKRQVRTGGRDSRMAGRHIRP